MNRLIVGLVLAAVAAGCCSVNCPRESGTTFAKDALQKYVDSGEMPGAVNVF